MTVINLINYKQEKIQKKEKALENQPIWKHSEVICIVCTDRWISVRPHDLLLKEIKCKLCDREGTVIETGQHGKK